MNQFRAAQISAEMELPKGAAQKCINVVVNWKEAEDGKLHPAYYMSKKTNTAEEKYDSYELEKTMQKKELITRIARWALQLEEFDYEIEHRAGSRMKHVDALSRYPVMMRQVFLEETDKLDKLNELTRTLIPVLTKLSLDDSMKWYKYVDRLQRILNSTISRAVQNGHHSNY
ncbi:transposon Tf2-8 polyprotein [Trichonephila clavipes]|nr:transposon Tf2-8 polyprotein [Trichonephila clavipes]